MARYTAGGGTAASAATDAHAIFQVWNPSSTKRIRLLEIGISCFAAPGAGAGFVLRRSTARGTAGSTVTPSAEHSYQRDAAPDSGWLLDLAAFSAQPTLASGELGPGWVFAAVTASGIVYPIPGGNLEIPPGTGIVVANRAAIAFPTAEVWAVVDD